ncbi:FmdB family zinc ribbon protein [Dietzia cinnamea]|uniref:Putative FmdB family regulatory protein n=1 Tax=Dietzia cinnamea TaxID=321318 RepID=A0A4R3ZRT4_9ACTN|nr:FmdB family zinc ribbon protein [Dietzia cinnamea]MCT2275730.1 FmdB family transcriptional regulator [Dietzia cinnamea]TCW22896.1 putative FmdB family regulatory protein [Dietzia cinnamea]
MPTYSYRCRDCDVAFDIQQSFDEDSLTVCPQCNGGLRKLFNTVGVVFKGSGFYRTDSRGAGEGGSSGSASSGSGSSNGGSSNGSSSGGSSPTGSSGSGSGSGSSATAGAGSSSGSASSSSSSSS